MSMESALGRPAPCTWRTLSAASLALLIFMLLLHRFTDGFMHWTLESARRARAETGMLRAPPLAVRSHLGASLTPWGTAQPPSTVHVIDFIYTRCPTVCLSLGTAFQQMQAELSRDTTDAAAIHLLSLSFDPEHDTQPELAAYAKRHHADARAWTIAAPLTPDGMDSIRRHWGVVAIPDGAGGYVHNGSIHVVDARGSIRGIYDHGDWPRALRRAREVAAQGS